MFLRGLQKKMIFTASVFGFYFLYANAKKAICNLIALPRIILLLVCFALRCSDVVNCGAFSCFHSRLFLLAEALFDDCKGRPGLIFFVRGSIHHEVSLSLNVALDHLKQ